MRSCSITLRNSKCPPSNFPSSKTKSSLPAANASLIQRGVEPSWPFKLATEEKISAAPVSTINISCLSRKEIGNPLDPSWPDASLAAYDRLTVEQYLLTRGVSQEGVELLKLSLYGPDYDKVSALETLSAEWLLYGDEKYMTFRGGNDQLPKAFASRLGDRIRYNAAVTKIRDTGERIAVTISGSNTGDSGASQQQVQADRVIITTPFAALRNIEIAASIPDAKRAIIQKMRYAPVTRVYLQTTTRFWTERKENGSATTDLPIGDVVDHTFTQPGTRGILEAQMYGGRAVYAKSLSEDDRLRFAARDIVKVHPGLEKNYEKGVSFAWDDSDPYSGGGWCWHAPGEMLADYPLVAQPHGRLHFAGEHTSSLVSTMEGAILSRPSALQKKSHPPLEPVASQPSQPVANCPRQAPPRSHSLGEARILNCLQPSQVDPL